MKKVRKVVKLNQDEILSILGEYFNDSNDKFVPKQVWGTHWNLFGKLNEDLRLVCILTNCEEDIEMHNIDLEEVDRNHDFTGDMSVDLKLEK